MGSTVTLSAALRMWIDFRSRSWTSPETSKLYRLFSGGWIKHLGSDTDLRSITAMHVQRLYLSREPGLSPATLNRERDILRSFFGWARDLGIVAEVPVNRGSWPTRDEEQHSRRSRVHQEITPGLLEKLLGILPWNSRRIILWLFVSGCRISESLRSEHSWVRDDPLHAGYRIMVIPAGVRKQRREHSIPLGEAALKIIGTGEGRIFPEAPAASSIRRILRHAAKSLGLPSLSPHNFRRSCATSLLNSGVPLHGVARYMGWRSAPQALFELVRDSYYLGEQADEIRRISDRRWHP